MLELRNITKSYPQRGSVLEGLNLQLKAGETIAIKGPSGSGKTTLLNIIGLLDKADSGQVFFNKSDITAYSPEEAARYRRNSIGFVFQDHLLLPHLTIIENIYLPLLADKKKSFFDERKEWVDSLINETGISHISANYPHEVSGGEAQRATLVRALVNKPFLLLADEPTGSLDSKNGGILGDLISKINSEFNISVLAVTHSDNFAAHFKSVLSLSAGKLK